MAWRHTIGAPGGDRVASVLVGCGAYDRRFCLAVMVVREVAVRMLHPKPAFAPLTVGPPILDTVVCVIVAIFVFMRIAPDAGRVWPWRSVATVVLVLSLIPDVLLARSHEMGGGWPEAYALMTMHLVVWAICITLLPGLAYSARADKGEDRLSIL